MESISRTYYTMLMDCHTVHDIQTTLKARIALSDRARSIELVSQYRKLFKLGKQSVEGWLQQWEKIYGDCVKNKVPEVTGD